MIKKRNQNGVSLIELVIAMAVIAVALLQIVGVIVHTTNVKQATRELTTAREATASMFSEMRAANYDSLATTYQNHLFDVPGLVNQDNTDDLNNDGISFQGLGTVIIDVSNSDLLDIAIEIEYDSTSGKSYYRARMMMTR